MDLELMCNVLFIVVRAQGAVTIELKGGNLNYIRRSKARERIEEEKRDKS